MAVISKRKISKQPEEIKKRLETCIGKCTGNKPHCPYHSCGDGCMDSMNRDALSLIQQLEAELDSTRLAFAQQTREVEEYKVELLNQVKKIIETLPKWISVEEQEEPTDKYCKGCKYYGTLSKSGSIRCCDYTYYTGAIRQNPPKTCEVKVKGKRPQGFRSTTGCVVHRRKGV